MNTYKCIENKSQENNHLGFEIPPIHPNENLYYVNGIKLSG